MFLSAKRTDASDVDSLDSIIGVSTRLDYYSYYPLTSLSVTRFGSRLRIVDTGFGPEGLTIAVEGSIDVENETFVYCEKTETSTFGLAVVPESVSVREFLESFHHVRGGPGGPPPAFGRAVGLFLITGTNNYTTIAPMDGLLGADFQPLCGDREQYALRSVSFSKDSMASFLTPTGANRYASDLAGLRVAVYAVAPNWDGCLSECSGNSQWAEGVVEVLDADSDTFSLPPLPRP
jgi:hypothetical protein